MFVASVCNLRQYATQCIPWQSRHISKELALRAARFLRHRGKDCTISVLLPEMGPQIHLGCSIDGGTPNCFMMENPIKLDDLGVPPIFGTRHLRISENF